MLSITSQAKNIFITSSFIFLIYFAYLPNHQEKQSNNKILHSSVWCRESDSGIKTCKFNNLCFNQRLGFLFFLSNASVISGLRNYSDLKSLMLSPIGDHDGVTMKLSMIQESGSSLTGFKYLKGNYFMMLRFKPDNFMHVIHDDLIPLFVKFRDICLGDVLYCSKKYHLIFSDFNEKGPYIEWYRALSSKEPLLFNNSFHVFPDVTWCFSSVLIGVSGTSFFQYGFKKPQGLVKSSLSVNDIKEFRTFFLNYFGVNPDKETDHFSVTLISRRINRRVINENYVFNVFSTYISKLFDVGKKLRIEKFDLSHNNTMDIIQCVATSDILVGMHGAETLLSLFLPDLSSFIELFPFGIFKENVSPIYSLSTSNSVHFKYFSWHNFKEENSVVHPEYPTQFGGILEFTEELKYDIYKTKSISAVKCCNNPYYLFRMYQDTLIDDTFVPIALEAIQFLKFQKPANLYSEWYFPSSVQNLLCLTYTDSLLISWMPPVNMNNAKPVYNVSILMGFKHHNFLTSDSSLYMRLGENVYSTIHVWVFCIIEGKQSFDNYCECKTSES